MIALHPWENLNRFLVDSIGRSADTIAKLAGDASTRIYHRARVGNSSYIIMDLWQTFAPASDPFFSIQHLLDSVHLPVPQIMNAAPDWGLVLLEDLGDTTLQIRVGSQPSSIGQFYPRAVELMLRMQRDTVEQLDPQCPAFHRRFDADKFMEEFEFFNRHFLHGYLGVPIESSMFARLSSWFLRISRELALQPQVFVHRDFHSRNLMIRSDDLVLIDFQDARMGLPEYDLASLLRDAYVTLPEPVVNGLLDQFHHGSLRKDMPPEQFRRCFYLTCIQRNIKALGTFGFQATVRANPMYIPYMDPLIAYLSCISKEPEVFEFMELFDVLGEHLAGVA